MSLGLEAFVKMGRSVWELEHAQIEVAIEQAVVDHVILPFIIRNTYFIFILVSETVLLLKPL